MKIVFACVSERVSHQRPKHENNSRLCISMVPGTNSLVNGADSITYGEGTYM
jgi:hypothetical protein